jgi:Asp-tRNA(Asn)/Glu-tRNA(Gln) amidotransferase A subunit family amidase
MTKLHELSLQQALSGLKRRLWSHTELMLAYCERIAQREPHVHAWSHLNVESALANAQKLDSRPFGDMGPLAGLPIGVKDVIDTADLPTRYGSPIYSSHQPANDAYCVSVLRSAGAVIMGKAATAEFAHTAPPTTRNPHNLKHTPGGSSSGSAACVADFMVPAALATQTGGSTIRPAAYCGIVGFKPSFGLINRSGVKPVAESLDCVGLMARDVQDIELLLQILAPGESVPLLNSGIAPKVGVYLGPHWETLEPACQSMFLKFQQRMEQCGATTQPLANDTCFEHLAQDQRLIMNFEAARALHYEFSRHSTLLSPALYENLTEGWSTSYAAYRSAQDRAQIARNRFSKVQQSFDLILTPSTQGTAPEGIKNSGTSLLNRSWSLLGVPALNLPIGKAANGLPVGVQLVGAYAQDYRLLAWAGLIQAAVQKDCRFQDLE